MAVSKLIKDLNQVPNIVGGLGLSIAAAQKALNLDYLEGLERILIMGTRLLGTDPPPAPGTTPTKKTEDQIAGEEAAKKIVIGLLTAFAPPRYQFTETTLDVKLDLAQSMDLGASVGLGLGFPGVAVNAALSVGYAYDYRAAAEVRTVLHATPGDPTLTQTLLSRAEAIGKREIDFKGLNPGENRTLKTMEGVGKLAEGAFEGVYKPVADKEDDELDETQ